MSKAAYFSPDNQAGARKLKITPGGNGHTNRNAITVHFFCKNKLNLCKILSFPKQPKEK
jgi:hypothetical protein